MDDRNKEHKYSATNFLSISRGVVTLCGSTKYFEQCMEANRQLTFAGWVVLMCGSWGHSYHKERESQGVDYSEVKKLHFVKILLSGAIVVVSDSSGYYGESTKAEIAFAEYHNIPVFYFDGREFTGSTEANPKDDLEAAREFVDYYKEAGHSLDF
jgi:hypothetical protein